MAYYGFNYRSTVGYVTDGTGEVEAYDSYPLVNGDITHGFFSGEVPSAADRNASNDRRLAGCTFVANSAGSTPSVWRYVLPAAGDWDIALAIGDAGFSSTNSVRLYDNGVLFATVCSATSIASNNFIDATGVTRTAAAWPGSNVALRRTFTSTIFEIRMGPASPGGAESTCLAHVGLTSIGGGGSSILLTSLERITRGQFRGQY